MVEKKMTKKNRIKMEDICNLLKSPTKAEKRKYINRIYREAKIWMAIINSYRRKR